MSDVSTLLVPTNDAMQQQEKISKHMIPYK